MARTPFTIVLTRSARDDLRHFKRFQQKVILDAVQEQLAHEPVKETTNRKPLRPNDLSSWEMRVGDIRVFYDVSSDEREVTIKAIGAKVHNRLLIRGKEYKL